MFLMCIYGDLTHLPNYWTDLISNYEIRLSNFSFMSWFTCWIKQGKKGHSMYGLYSVDTVLFSKGENLLALLSLLYVYRDLIASCVIPNVSVGLTPCGSDRLSSRCRHSFTHFKVMRASIFSVMYREIWCDLVTLVWRSAHLLGLNLKIFIQNILGLNKGTEVIKCFCSFPRLEIFLKC